MKILLLAHVASTLFMTGVIWIVQVVHYPLFAKVGAAGFVAYEADHARLITYVVFPAMTVELLTGLALVWHRPAAVPAPLVWVGLGLIGVVWLSTAVLQVPLHGVLSSGFEADAHRRLVATNWIRTVAWTLRAGVVLAMLRLLLPPS